MLSKILFAAAQSTNIHFELVALSYRGYWSSSGRPSQTGIELDSQAFLDWASKTYGDDIELVLWGQSIGAGIATQAAASYLRNNSEESRTRPTISRLILETPFVSIRRMLAALYPENWVPYKYLWPFLRNWWDSEQALRQIAQYKKQPRLLLLPAGKDEVVPAGEVEYLDRLCREVGLHVQRKDVLNALHNEASTKMAGRSAIVDFLKNAGQHGR